MAQARESNDGVTVHRTAPAEQTAGSRRADRWAARVPVWGGLVVLTPVATALACLALWPLWHSDLPLALSLAALFAALFAMGLALLREPGQFGSGAGLVASAVMLLVAWAEEWNWGPTVWICTVVGSEWLFLGAWALYRYPEGRLGRFDRWFFAAMATWFVVPQLAEVLVSEPEWQAYSPDVWWPHLTPNRPVYDALKAVDQTVLLLLALTYLARWWVRLASAGPVARRRRLPAGVAAVVATVAAALVPLGKTVSLPDALMDRIYLVEALAMVAVPFALLVAVLRRQLARARVAELVLAIKGPPSTEAIRDALSTALQDPSLELAYWDPVSGAYRHGDGRPVTEVARTTATVETTRGVPLALLLADPELVRDPDLLAAAATVVGFSLEIARLVETVRGQLHEVQSASARAVQAADDERRRLAQDLHDGAQQHLLALGPMLGAVEASTGDPATAAQLGEVRSLLSRALKELREFSHGIHPSVLAHGLDTAVTELARTLPMPVVVDLPGERLPTQTEHAAYLILSEALANAAKHSDAHRVTVTGHLSDGALRLSVRDDGVGGACAEGLTGGLGIRNIRDRVAAFGGTFQLDSPPGRGTSLEVVLPCG